MSAIAFMDGELGDKARSMVEEAEAGAGLVRVRINGNFEVLAVEIDALLLREDKSMAQDLVRSAMNQSIERMRARVGALVEREMERRTRSRIDELGKGGVLADLVKGKMREAVQSTGLPLCRSCGYHPGMSRCYKCGGDFCGCDGCEDDHARSCDGRLVSRSGAGAAAQESN
jgi:DNA-binding YbaB/EbfC family protein